MALHPNPLTLRFLQRVLEERPDAEAWRRQYIGSTLLRDDPVPLYKLSWDQVKSENNLAGIYAINGRPVPGSDLAFATKFAEMINLMSGRTLDPQDVATLREPGEAAVQSRMMRSLRQRAQDNLRDKIAICDDEVDALKEYLIMHAVQGQVVWPPVDADGNPISVGMPQWGNVQLTINYPMRDIFVQNATTLTGYNSRTGGAKAWSDMADGKPLLDLEVIAELIIHTTGLDAHGSKIIMGGEVLSRLAFSSDFTGWIKGTERGTNYVATEDMKDYIKTKVGYTLQEYNARWTYRTNEGTENQAVNSVPFLEYGHILILPPGVNLGEFAVGPSPDGNYQSSRYQWMVIDREPPWETRVGCGEVGFPLVKRADDIFILDVFS